ncbi:hypothetical protein [Lacrimispora sp. 210928-DFI.3.58]|nr:hypothetical protein [Lacrimispora sp. 210928-DFI.3.58]
MTRKYIRYKDKKVYALYYKNRKTIYYNLDFEGVAQIYIIVF